MYKYEVKWDKETNTVSCGALSLQRYTEMTPDNFFSKVADKKYLVFSVQKDGVHTSTVGYTLQNDMWIIHQHYGKCNKRVTDDDEITIAQRMFNLLNNG